MAEPSQYELDAWSDIQAFKGRQVSRRMGEVGQRSRPTAAVGDRATKYLEDHPGPKPPWSVDRGSRPRAPRSSALGPAPPATPFPVGPVLQEVR